MTGGAPGGGEEEQPPHRDGELVTFEEASFARFVGVYNEGGPPLSTGKSERIAFKDVDEALGAAVEQWRALPGCVAFSMQKTPCGAVLCYFQAGWKPIEKAAGYAPAEKYEWRSYKQIVQADARPEVVIVGSALGYQCAFAAAAGLRCTGYDILAGCMVGTGAAAAARHGVSHPTLHTESLDLFTSKKRDWLFKSARLVWLNDKGWSLANVGKALALAAEQLSSGAVVVSYGSEPIEPPAGLALAETLSVPTSWSGAEMIRLFVKS